MVKVKKKVEVEEKDLVKEYWEDAAADIMEEKKEAAKKEEKSQVLPSKEKICEFYWITDEEILNQETDYSRFWISDKEVAVLKEWWVEHMKATIKDVTFDIYDKDDDVRAILEKYGVLPTHVIENKLDELWLNDNEKEIITDYYYKRAWIKN